MTVKTGALLCSILVFSAVTASASDIPHLRKQGTATQLIVDDKPFLVLAGELSNNAATSVEFMKPVWPKLAESKVNTVLAGVSWAQIEPDEGKFDFHVLDGIVRDARSNNLRLVLLWFASWKNGLSSYPPDWVKKDFERFPRAQIQSGKSLELLSPSSDASRDADARAFAALMRHVKEIDGQQHTVIMIQVENEIGMQLDSRDRSPLANKAFDAPVPKELMDYLQQHKDTLIPEFREVWGVAGYKTSGNWQEVFGHNDATDEIFMAWNFACYVGRVVEAGKAEYPIPMFLNAALPRTTSVADEAVRGHEPGTRYFAIGGPMDDLLDVWRAGAPRIDMLSPDAYQARDFAAWCAKYARSGTIRESPVDP
jgi:beta-galactosidase GanA